MTGEWLTVKWVVLGLFVLTLFLVCFAFGYFWRNLRLRRKTQTVAIVTLVVMWFPHTVRDVFENVGATRVAYVIAGVAILAVIGVLVREIISGGKEIEMRADG